MAGTEPGAVILDLAAWRVLAVLSASKLRVGAENLWPTGRLRRSDSSATTPTIIDAIAALPIRRRSTRSPARTASAQTFGSGRPVDRAGRAQRVDQQAGDGHRPDAARHRRDRARDLRALPRKSTSPTSRVLPSRAGTRLMPTSITVAPGLIQSPRTISGRPTAANSRSARRHTAGRSRGLRMRDRDGRSSRPAAAAPAACRRCWSGRSPPPPCPASDGCTVFARMTQPSGVHGTSAGSPVASRPALTGWKPSTSLRRIDRVEHLAGSRSAAAAAAAPGCRAPPGRR